MKKKTTIGWQEWCCLPDINLPLIKAKIDTGAATSSLHAFNIKKIDINGEKYVSFDIHPLKGHRKIIVHCQAPVVDYRTVTSSNGHREKRYVIKTKLVMGGITRTVQVTLANRENMMFRMLVGREAMRKFLVDPQKKCLLGDHSSEDALKIYQQQN